VGRLRAIDPVPLAAAAAAATFPLAALHAFGRTDVEVDGGVHIWGVGLSAVAATIASLGLTIVGVRRDDGRTVLLGIAFSTMAGLLAVHGLTTPGFLVDDNGVVAFSGAATLPAGGALLAVAAVRPVRTFRMRTLVAVQAVLLAGVAGLGLVGVLFPQIVPSVPRPAGPTALATLAAGVLLYGFLWIRSLRTYRLTRRLADLSVVTGIVWLAAALVAALTLTYTDVGWWLGHAFELIGIALVGGPVALDLHRASQSRTLTGGLRAAELVSSEESFLGAHVRNLTRMLAERDEYTEGHTRRVALLAVQVGEEVGLSPERLRALATGALLHDIGKLGVPDPILKKPGALTVEEYELVKEHPVAGERLLEELGGFSHDVRHLVRHHHERLNGSGYPDHLRGPELDLETRILGVCDVYDALLSTRVYREAWTDEEARALLRRGAGTIFDRRCVDALERVLARERAPALVAA
jgi:hypothetical protein